MKGIEDFIVDFKHLLYSFNNFIAFSNLPGHLIIFEIFVEHLISYSDAGFGFHGSCSNRSEDFTVFKESLLSFLMIEIIAGLKSGSDGRYSQALTTILI